MIPLRKTWMLGIRFQSLHLVEIQGHAVAETPTGVASPSFLLHPRPAIWHLAGKYNKISLSLFILGSRMFY